MKIVSAEFLLSAVDARGFPPPVLPEVAFAGKSNVGKSSLINAVLNRKGLVKTSSTPGKTQAVNFFLINGQFRFVDLPGYGFAKVPLAVRESWQGLVTSYLQARANLRGVVVILDIRHDPGPLDQQLKAWLDAAEITTLYVANKMDKLKRSQVAGRLHALAAGLGLPEPPLACSASTGVGRPEIWRTLGDWVRAPRPAERERSAS